MNQTRSLNRWLAPLVGLGLALALLVGGGAVLGAVPAPSHAPTAAGPLSGFDTPTPTRTATRTATRTPTRTPTRTATATATPDANGCSPVVWTAVSGATASGSTLTKLANASSGWSAGGISTVALDGGDGSVSATVVATTTLLMFGLNHNNSTVSYTDIDYAIYTYATTGRLLVFENGVNKGSFNPYSVGDALKVGIDNGVVKYYQNGVVFYTSTIVPIYPLVLDAAIYTPGAALHALTICVDSQPVFWTTVQNATASGNLLTKPANGTTSWNAGAISTLAIQSGTGYVQVTVPNTSTLAMFGLSHGNSGVAYSDIDFALYAYATTQKLLVYEGGTSKGQFGGYTTGDILRVAVSGGVVRYYRNGALLYTSTQAPVYPLLLDTALYTPGVPILNARISGANLGP